LDLLVPEDLLDLVRRNRQISARANPGRDDVTQAVLLECLRKPGYPALSIAQHLQDGYDQPLPASAGGRAASHSAYDIIEYAHNFSFSYALKFIGKPLKPRSF
jgi:hypothetical protein